MNRGNAARVATCDPCGGPPASSLPCVDVWASLTFERRLAANLRVADLFVPLDDDAEYWLMSVDAVEIGNARLRLRDPRGYPIENAPIPGTMASRAFVPAYRYPPGSKIGLEFVGDVVESSISLYLNVVKRYYGGV